MKMADELKVKPFYAQDHLFLGELHARSGRKEKALESSSHPVRMSDETCGHSEG